MHIVEKEICREKVVFNIGPYSFTTSAFIIGIILVQQLSIEEQDSIGNWLQLIGLTMQTYASQKITLAANDDNSKKIVIVILKR